MMTAQRQNQDCEETKEKVSTRNSLVYLLVLFVISIGILGIVYKSFPELKEEEKAHVKLPLNLDDAKKLGIVLHKYKEDHFLKVYFGISITYVFLQTFAIPGSIFLSVMSGFLFPFIPALILVCTCSALGASLCFMISQLVGRRLIKKYFPEKAEAWATTVHKHKDNLLNYVIFLRVTPFLPNWFINLTAPVIGVPLWPFAFGTFLGVAPPSFVALQAGQTLHDMSATDSAFSWTSVILLIVFGCFSLIPIYFKDRLKEKFE